MDLKLLGESLLGNRIFHSFKVLSHRLLMHYKGNKDILTVQKSCRHHLNQVIEVTITNNDKLNQVPPDTRHREGHSIA